MLVFIKHEDPLRGLSELRLKKEYIMNREIKVVNLLLFKAWGIDMEFWHCHVVYKTQGKVYQVQGIHELMGGAVRDAMRLIQKAHSYDLDDTFEPIVAAAIDAILDNPLTDGMFDLGDLPF